MQLLLALAALAALLSIGMALIFEFAVARTGTVRPLAAGELGETQTKLSVVIPARNEQEDVEQALNSVLAQQGVDLQVVVVSDHSTDETAPIVRRIAERDARVGLIEDPPLRRGWLGKPNAMQHGLAAATEDLILFTDADIIHTPTSFATGVAMLADDELDLLSLTPLVICESFWENVVIPLTLIPFNAQFAMTDANDPNSSEAWAAGSFILTKRGALQDAGGIEAIRSEILDDTALARVLKKAGRRLGFHLAPRLMRVRMFKSNRHAFWGPTKNAIALAFSKSWMAIPAAALPVLVFWIPIAALLVGAYRGDALLIAVGLLQPLTCIWLLNRVQSICRFRWAKALCFPLIVVSTACVLARAYYEQHVRRTLIWRGRAVDLTQVE